MTRSHVLLALVMALPIAAIFFVLAPALSPIEDQCTHWKYLVRGAEHGDSNVVIVYIDNEAVKTLGWPVRRNFHALMLHALTDLRPRAVGLDVVFEDTKLGYREFPEYDTLLASTIGAMGHVVLASYFDATGDQADSAAHSLPPLIGLPRVHGDLLQGKGLHLPLPAMTAAAAGIGHANFLDDGATIPAVILGGDRPIPAFAVEVFRVATATSRTDVLMHDGLALLDSSGRERTIPLSEKAVVHLNFPGPLRSFAHYPFLDVLRSYDDLRHGRTPAIPVQDFQGKIILVGVMAEGRSDFRSSPVDARTPSLLIHATLLDNALRGRFLSVVPPFWVGLLILVLAFVCSLIVLSIPRPWNIATGFGAIAAAVLVAIILFSVGAVQLPIVGLGLGGMVAVVTGLMVRWKEEGKKADALAAERETILQQLKDREEKVSNLERALAEGRSVAGKDKPEELQEEIRRYKAEIVALTSKAYDMEEYTRSEETVEAKTEEFEGIFYSRTGAMHPVIEFVKKIAPSDAPVLILGESGTGKELIARAIHHRSTRADGPFIAVNCGALAETLLESELFGHEKGAFTGAVKEKVGRFELADGGTILLDEIGEVSEAFQLKILRVLQENELERVGGTKTIKVNVRVLAATNKDLHEEVAAKRFREDLYYRLNVLSIALPRLRDRRDDVGLLVQQFLARDGGGLALSKGVGEMFSAYAWPGNVRELESVVRRAVLLAKADKRTIILVRDLPEGLASSSRMTVPLHEQVLEMVRAKGFSRSAITDTAMELGGLNRGTVAEYLRGECLQLFAESGYKADEAAKKIVLSDDEAALARVEKRLKEYLVSIVEGIDRSKPWEASQPRLKPKTKNLPQRYHGVVDGIAEAYHRGVWSVSK